MKKITLLGDSIRLGYGAKVLALLGDNYEVFQTEDNCRFAKYTLRMIYDCKDQIAEELSFDSFSAGFHLAWKLGLELRLYEKEHPVSTSDFVE